jgi:hypothetical protein
MEPRNPAWQLLLSFFLIIAVIIFSNCSTSENETATIKWIGTHKKPIVCNKSTINEKGDSNYTLIDADGNIYNTGYTTFELPDTIKPIINTKSNDYINKQIDSLIVTCFYCDSNKITADELNYILKLINNK